MISARRPGALALLLGLAACGRSPVPPPAEPAAADPRPALPVADTAARSSALPPVPTVKGPLAIRVVYPTPDAVVRARDSSFLFGSAGTGEAKLSINGHPVRVWPNGAWLAWIPLPHDSVMQFRIVAHTATDTATLDYGVRRGNWEPVRETGLWIDTASMTPRGDAWWPADEYLTFSVRAAERARLRLILTDGSSIWMGPEARLEEVPEGVRAFDLDTLNLVSPLRRDRYVAALRGRPVGPGPGPVLPPRDVVNRIILRDVHTAQERDSSWAVLEAVRDADTVRARWPIRLAVLDTLPVVAELDDDTTASRRGETDRITVGRAVAGGTYHWFFPAGTRAAVSGRLNDDLRLRLSPEAEAWVPVAEARSAGVANDVPAVVGSVRFTPMTDRVRLRIPVTRRVPFQVAESDRGLTLRLYGAVGDVNWIQYGPADSLIRRAAWAQDRRNEVTLSLELSRRVWGYYARWDRGDLILDVRRPPALDQGGSLKGRLIAVDPGHPPAGTTGPTGLREAEANLAIGLEVKRLLEEQGAQVFITRTADVPLELWPRVDLAERSGAEVLVSIHNNALPDGVNPLTNNGSSVYYNQPRSIPLARAIQEQLVRRLGVRDLGVGRGDLAMVRTTWMPSALTEGLFVIVPEQEAALRSPQGAHLYAEAVVDGLRSFLRERALDP